MVSTRRAVSAASDSDQPAQPSQQRRGNQPASSRDASAEPRKRAARRKAADTQQQAQPATEASAAVTATTANTVTTATSTVTGSTRRTRSAKQDADSPLRSLPQAERTIRKRGRKRITSATPDPEPVPEAEPEEEPQQQPAPQSGQQSAQQPTPESTQESTQDDGENQGLFFTDQMKKENEELRSEIIHLKDENTRLKDEIRSREAERVQLRDEIIKLSNQDAHRRGEYHHLEEECNRLLEKHDVMMVVGRRLEEDKGRLQKDNLELENRRSQLRELVTGLHEENRTIQDFADQINSEFARYRVKIPPPVEAFGNATTNGTQDNVDNGWLLHKVEASAKARKTVTSSANLEKIYGSKVPVLSTALLDPVDTEAIAANPVAVEPIAVESVTAEPVPKAVTEVATPTTPSASSIGRGSFFSRTLSAFKSPFAFFSTPSPAASAPASPTPRAAVPEPESLTEVLTQTPTPVGERVRTKKKKLRNPLLKALTNGIKPDELAKAEVWAKQVVAQMKNDPQMGEKRKRLEAPVLLKDLKTLPSRKPWENGFGDPLADYDDDDEVPAWAIYADMMAEEEHQTKKHKSYHEVTMEDEVPSLNESFAANHHKTVDTHGNSASLYDLHPRSATVPSPMFDNPLIHTEGGNVFRELQGHSSAEQTRATDRASMLRKSEPVQPNSSQGSFSAPDPFGESDSDTSELVDGDSESALLWTQPPPAAPVPAHASLPVSLSSGSSVPGAQRDEQAAASSSQPVDEVERQRAKLMKHTPAKPSRLREVKYPSPSVKSDAGNDSILAATPSHLGVPSVQIAAPIGGFNFDIPDPEPLELGDPELEAATRAYLDSEEFKTIRANAFKGDVILTYDEEDEMSDD